MSKNSNSSNQPAASSSGAGGSAGQKQDKSSFWPNWFNSRSKTGDAKPGDGEENGELGRANNGTAGGRSGCCARPMNSSDAIKMSNNLKESLSETNTVAKRIAFIKEFNENISRSHVCYSDLKLIIYKTIDVFNLKASSEELEDLENVDARPDLYRADELHALKVHILRMYARLVDSQFELVKDEVRKILFDVLCRCIPFKRPDTMDDATGQQMRNQLNESALELIGSLTNQGKCVCYLFKLQIGELFVDWFDDFVDSPTDLTCKYLAILTDLIRFNASAFLKTYSEFVKKTSHFFSAKHENSYLDREIHLCLELFDVIFRYGTLPSEVLNPYLTTLCIAVNYENLKELSWKILRNLINNTNLSYTVLQNLSDRIDTADLSDREQVLIVCGSIHFITNSLWNDEVKVDTIKHQPSYILPTLSKLLKVDNLTISVHVAIAIRQLLETQTTHLEPATNGHTATEAVAFVQQPHPTTKRKDLMCKLSGDADGRQSGLLLIYWKNVWNILEQLTDQCGKYAKESNQRQPNLSGSAAAASAASAASAANQTTTTTASKSKPDHAKLFEVMDGIAAIVERLFLGDRQFNYDERSFNFLCVYTNLQMLTLGFENEYPPVLAARIRILLDRFEKITNSNYENWLPSLVRMMDLCFRSNLDTSLRIRTLHCLQARIRANNVEKDEEQIIDKIVVPYLKDVDQEIDFKLRDQILRFLIAYLKETNNNLLFIKVFEIISRTLKRSLVRSRNNSDTSNDVTIEEDPNVLIVRGLMEMFEAKIYEKDCAPSIEVFRLLSSHVRSHYCEGSENFEKISYSMRLKILRFMFSIKPNHDGYIGIQKDEQPIRFSKFLRCKTANQLPKSPSISSANQMLTSYNMPLSANQFSYEEMFSYINLCLSKERDWNLLAIVLEHLPFVLSNSHIVYSTNFEQVIRIICENCLTLCREFANPNSSNYINMPKHLKSAELQNYVFSVLTSLIPYRDFIKPDLQTLIVSEVSKGLLSKQSIQQCITCLAIFATEFQDAISKELPRILNQLSKTTASQQLAIPILEFLSILNLWPNLYSSYVVTEFLSIFAIIIPYTNPMKFDEYSVALAYRVATLWYLSSRYQFRKTITDFIIKQLPENIKFSHRQSKENIYNNDEYRKRSSSLNTENDLNKKAQDANAPNRLSGYSNNSLASAVAAGNAHQNSPSLPSPAHQNSTSVFNFSSADKPNQVPISPNTKQLPGNSQQISSHSQLQQSQIEVLHTEYIECFVDLMSRNVVCGSSTLPNQDPISKFLLENGQSETWLLGNKLITITTSSCNSKAIKGRDLCESCHNKLNAFEGKSATTKPLADADDVFNEPAPSSSSLQFSVDTNLNGRQSKMDKANDFHTNRRRHQSAFVPTASGSITRHQLSRDDSQIENNSHMYNLCRSWASGWAEIFIRTATGNTSWITKLQNSLFSNFQSNEMNDLLINHLITGSDRPNELVAGAAAHQSTVSLNQPPLGQNLVQISEQPYLAASTTNLSQQSTSRCRSNTISNSSDMSLKRNERLTNSFLRPNENDLKFKNKMHPSFVFLQFFHQGAFANAREPPILLTKNTITESTLKLFDLIQPSETYKVGIIYVDKGQTTDRQAILANESGSERYMQFVKRMGTLIKLDNIDSKKVFIGGLSTDGTDGDFACIYHENLTQVVFHVATFMPNKESDPKCNDKIRHIGNNHVCIVYNDSQEEFDFSVIKGQWLKVCIVVTPCAHEQNIIQVQATSELEGLIMYRKPFQITISDQNTPHFVRQLSISTSLISLVCQCKGQNFTSSPFLSNWVNRIRKIKHVRERAKNQTTMRQKSNANNSNEDVSSALGGETNLASNSLENFTHYI